MNKKNPSPKKNHVAIKNSTSVSQEHVCEKTARVVVRRRGKKTTEIAVLIRTLNSRGKNVLGTAVFESIKKHQPGLFDIGSRVSSLSRRLW